MNRHAIVVIASLATPVVVLSGCSNQASDSGDATTTTGTAEGPLSTQIKTADGTAVADATIDFTDGYATVTVETVGGGAAQLSPGFHGLHLHEFGRCEPNSSAPGGGATSDFASAGDHLQAPGNTGMPASGDLPPLFVRSDGAGKLVTTTDAFTEEQLTDSDGSSIMLHQGADMPGATEGADIRLACGVISPASAATTSVSTSVSTSTVTSVAPPPPATVTETTPAPTSAPAETSPTTTTVTETTPSTTTPPTTTPPTTTPPPPAGEG